MRPRPEILLLVAAAWLVPAPILCLGANPHVRRVPLAIKAGPWDNPSDQPALVFETTIEVPGAAWIRVVFGRVHLAHGSTIVLSSHADSSLQVLDAVSVHQWRRGSAYFNGPAVQVEVWAGPHTTGTAVAIDTVQAGTPPDGAVQTSQCGFTDDRLPAANPAVARILNVNGSPCTAALVGEAGCLLSAGHCFATAESVVVAEFNVPASLADGSLVHPPARDQYAIDPRSVRVRDAGLGHDWAWFGCFPNPVTGLTPAEAQRSRLTAATALPESLPATVVVTGHGVDTGSDNHVQQSDRGLLHAIPDTPLHLQYEVDTQAGNSGSPVILQRTGQVVGIHTHSGCVPIPPPYNRGTPITEPDLQAAMATCVTGTCPGDVNDDLVVNVKDLLSLLARWGPCSSCGADFNGNGAVDRADLVTLLVAWGPCR